VSYVDCSTSGAPYDPGGSYSIGWEPGAYIVCYGFDDTGYLIGDIDINVEQGTSASKAIAVMGDPPSQAVVQYRYTDGWVYEYNGWNVNCHCVE
jgi:hypothetical protein